MKIEADTTPAHYLAPKLEIKGPQEPACILAVLQSKPNLSLYLYASSKMAEDLKKEKSDSKKKKLNWFWFVTPRRQSALKTRKKKERSKTQMTTDWKRKLIPTTSPPCKVHSPGGCSSPGRPSNTQLLQHPSRSLQHPSTPSVMFSFLHHLMLLKELGLQWTPTAAHVIIFKLHYDFQRGVSGYSITSKCMLFAR